MNVKKSQILQDFATAEAAAQTQLTATTDPAGRTKVTQEIEGLRRRKREVEAMACGGEFLPSGLSPIGDSTQPSADDV